jgi:polar amino acid transport system substrate-binding protein
MNSQDFVKRIRKKVVMQWKLNYSAVFFIMMLIFVCLPLAGSETKVFDSKPAALVADDWCPQHCEIDSTHKGYVIDIIEQALKLEGIPFNIVYMPWLRAMSYTESGEFDGLLTPTADVFKQFSYHSEALGYQQYCFYVNNSSSWTYTQPTDLLGKRIAHLKESGFGELDTYFEQNKNKIKVEELYGSKDFTRNIFLFLGAGRADVIVMTSDVFDFGVRNGDIGKGFRSAGCLSNERLAVGLSKSNPERSRLLGQSLDRGIQKLRASGQLKTILAEYGINLWPPLKK